MPADPVTGAIFVAGVGKAAEWRASKLSRSP